MAYIKKRQAEIVRLIYYKDLCRRMSTPERVEEHCVGYINIATILVLIGCQLSLRLKLLLPLKLIPTRQECTTTTVGQEPHQLGLKIHSSPPNLSKLISASQSSTAYAEHGPQDRSHGACSSIKWPRCQTRLGRALEINLKGFPWPHQSNQVFAITGQQ